MAQASVTSGNELNSYQGNAALAGGVNETGFAPMDFSPLQVFALKKYETNKLDYEQQQKDKVALEKMYTNPDLNVFLDPALAGQIDPDMNELKELSKKHLQMNPNSQDWYRFHELYTQINKKNANAKAVQTLMDNARTKAGISANKHEQENLIAFADKLKKYKLGDEIPVNNTYFPSMEEYIPTGETAKWKVEQPSKDGKSKSIVEKSVNNSLGLMKAYDRLQIVDPESQNTWKNMAHVALEDVYDDKGSGGMLLDNLNKTTADVYQKNKDYNISLLQGKYNTEYKEFLKANPKATFDNFLAADPIKQKELQEIKDGLSFLNGDVVVKSAADDPRRFAGFTYFQDKDGKLSRLSINDKEFAARYGATKNLPGEKEILVSTKLDETGSKIALLDAKRNLVNEQAKTQGTVRAKNRAMTNHVNQQTKQITPLPISVEPLIAREAELTAITQKSNGSHEYQFLIPYKKIAPNIKESAGIGMIKPLPKDATKEQTDEHNKEKLNIENGMVQLRFYKNGKDVTKNVGIKIASGNGTLEGAIKAQGIVRKYVDKNGNIVGTTESMDMQTLEKNNTINSKGEAPLGMNLPDQQPETVDFNY